MQAGIESMAVQAPPQRARHRSAAAPTRHSDGWRGRGASVAAFILLLVTIESIRVWSTADERGILGFIQAHGRWLVFELATMGVGAVLGPVLVEAAGRQGWRHLVLTATTTFAAVGAGVAVLHFGFAADVAHAAGNGGFGSGNALLLRAWWFFSTAGFLFGIFASSQERALGAIRAAQAAELECAEMQSDAIELRLRALQARLEPRLVFALLDEIGTLYGRDPAAADALLDDLIAYLRAALPQLPDDVPTLADEAALVESLLRILPDARAHALAVAVRIPEALGSRRFPSAVLAPLACDAAAAGATCLELSAAPGMGEAGVRVVEVSIAASGIAGVPGWSAQHLEAMRQALARLFGASAALELQVRPEGPAVVIRCPAPDARPAVD
jgi:hypothetical protein